MRVGLALYLHGLPVVFRPADEQQAQTGLRATTQRGHQHGKGQLFVCLFEKALLLAFTFFD